MGKRKWYLIRAAAVCGLGVTALWLWTAGAESCAHYTPDYPREELNQLLIKESLTEEDYNLLFLQTGLGPAGVDQLFQEGRQGSLLYLQERFFMPVRYECRQANFFCRGERLLSPVGGEVREACLQHGGESLDMADDVFDFLPTARTGDVLVTFSGHVFGWRSGHAGLVVDGEAGLTLEAISLGKVSEICQLASWENYPCFALLRLKGGTEEEAAEIASYAVANLEKVPYDVLRLTDGLSVNFVSAGKDGTSGTRALSAGEEPEADQDPELISGTQCAHLVWSAYSHFGYDLDSDGGRIVTPRDLYDSELLEVVQIYGIRPLRKP